ncbi:MAG: hypothetical protein ACOZNI_28040 [Myxococcota bacterium]
MGELQEHYKVWDEREGLLTVGHLPQQAAQLAILRSVATMNHAARLFDLVVETLGARAWIDPEGGEIRRRLYLRDPERPDWIVPVPLLEHAWIAGIGQWKGPVMYNPGGLKPEDEPDDWKPGDPPYWEKDPEPDIVPTGPLMRGGELHIRAGHASVEIRYDDRGLRCEAVWSAGDTFTYGRYWTTRPFVVDPLSRPPTPTPLPLLCRADLDRKGQAIERLAEMVLEMEPARAVPHRMLFPLPMPAGVSGAWSRALWALREAAFEGRIPAGAGWVVVDAFEGKALAFGPGFDEAVAAWREEVARIRPRPPKPPKEEAEQVDVPDQDPGVIENKDGKVVGVSSGTIRIEAPVLADLAWPIPLPQHVPEPVIPEVFARAGFTRWVRLFGQHGAVGHALLREDPAGFTLVGEHVLDIVDPATMDEEMDAYVAKDRAWYEAEAPSFPAPWKDPANKDEYLYFRAWDDARRCRKPLESGGGSWGGFTARNLDGDSLPWQVARLRRRGT